MCRKTLLAGVVCLAAAAAGLAVVPHFLPAQTTQPTEITSAPATDNKAWLAPAHDNPAALPVKKVILFTSGVGYFQCQGQVNDTERVNLSFPVQDVNDLLKSLVLRDLDGGKVSTVSYDSQDPIGKTLKSFAINLGGNPGFADILQQARGEKVNVAHVPAGGVQPILVGGTIVSVERKKQPVSKDAVADVEYLNILSDKGMTSVNLAEVVQVHFENPALASELNRALDVVAKGHDAQKKTVSLLFNGKGKRTVQVGYVVEHPIWKTSYRLVLGKDAKPYLQGWALVENPTSEDWNNVELNLVSGRPVSFKMDLYQPQYLDRPQVHLQQFAHLKPMAYEGEMTRMVAEHALQSKARAIAVPYGMAGSANCTTTPCMNGAAPMPTYAGASMPVAMAATPPPMAQPVAPNLGVAMRQSVPSMAQGVQLGDQFQYVINQPVSVARQKSALVPIVNTAVDGNRVSIFNEANLAKFPMLGLRFKNTTQLHLMQGPVTVFAEDSYAGDALINDVQPGEERLLSYAVDLATEVRTEYRQVPDHKVKVAVSRGIISRTVTLRDTKTYTVKNRSDQDKLVILEHPVRTPEYVLVTPAKEPTKTQNFYRFEIHVPADATRSFPVVEEKKVVEQIALTNQNTNTLAYLLQNTSVSSALKAALQKAIDLRNQQAKTEAEIAQRQNKLHVISEEQARQRENMKVIPQSDPLYKKYLQKFNTQEEQIDTLRSQIDELRATAEQQRRAYEDYVQGLSAAEDVEQEGHKSDA